MKIFSCVTLSGCALSAFLMARSLDIEKKETIEKIFSFSDPAAVNQVKIDTLEGSIDVAGYNGREVQMVIRKSLRAESEEKIQLAERDVRLQFSNSANTAEAYVDAPWRCKDGSINYRGWRHYGYRVRFDFEVRVPKETGLFLRAVNNGEIKVQRVEGKYDIENINGGIEMLEVAGPGRVYALNGKVRVLFSKNPPADSFFGSLNGDVDVSFLPNLSADIRFKTFNGNVYTDFPVSYLPNSAPIAERHNGKYVYRSGQFSGVRVGNGGPEIKFDGFNGNIRIIKRDK